MAGQLPIQSYSHLCIRVSDIERSQTFYRDVLGMDVMIDVELTGQSLERILGGIPGATGRMVIGKIGGQRVELMELRGVPLEQGPHDLADGVRAFPNLGVGSFTFQVDDIDDAYEACRKYGIQVESEPIDMIGGFRLFFINDPDGVRIELAQYPPGESP